MGTGQLIVRKFILRNVIFQLINYITPFDNQPPVVSIFAPSLFSFEISPSPSNRHLTLREQGQGGS